MKGLLLDLVEDGVHEVVECVFEQLLPAVLAWNPEAAAVMLPDILARITSIVSQCVSRTEAFICVCWLFDRPGGGEGVLQKCVSV